MHDHSTRAALAAGLLAVAALLFVAGGLAVTAGGADAQAAPAGGTLGGDLNLTDANVTVAGASANDTTGWAVAAADVNGDGHDDLLVGAPTSSAGGTQSGAVYLFYGPVEDGTLNASTANATFVGAPGDYAGRALATGDVDGDGVADVVVGAPSNDTLGKDAGAVYVLTDAANRSGQVDLATNATALLGTEAGGQAGRAVAVVNTSAGNVTLVGAPYANTTALGGGPPAGAVYLLRGAPAGGTLPFAANATYVGDGDALAGWAVAAAGDVDNDSRAEALVGAPGDDAAGDNAGAAYVVETNVTGTVPLSSVPALRGAAAGDRAGWSVAGADDTDGDGVADVLVGAPYNDTANGSGIVTGNDSGMVAGNDSDIVAGNDSGAAYLVYGHEGLNSSLALPGNGTTLRGAAPGDRAGWSVAAAGSGDVTCDGLSDVLVGAPYNDSAANGSGSAYLVYGRETRPNRTSLAEADGRFRGAGPGDRAGWVVAAGGDVTGDGFEDVLVGAPYNDSLALDPAGVPVANATRRNNTGAAYVLAGRCPAEPAPLEPVEVRQRCTPNGGEVTVTNTNDRRVTVVLEGPTGDETRVTLGAGQSHAFSALADGEYTLRTLRGDRQIGDAATISVDCPTEPVRVRTRCTADGGQLRLRNPNEEPIRVLVEGPDRDRRVTIGPGERRTLDALGDGDYRVRTFATTGDGGYEIGGGQSARIDCPTESVVASNHCTPDGAEVRLRNPNEEPIRVLVTGPGGDRRLTIDGGAARTLGPLADGEYRVRTFAAIPGNAYEIGGGQSLTVSCPTEQVQVRTQCTEDGGQVLVRNPNEEPVQVDLDGPGDFERRVTVGAGETRTFDALDDGAYRVRTLSTIDENVYEIGSGQSATVDCAPSLAAVTVSERCGPDGGRITATNPNDAAVQVVLVGPDGSERRAALGPGESRTVRGLADGDYRVRTLTADGGRQIGDDRRATISCPTAPVQVRTQCTEDGGQVVVRNPNGEPVQVDLDGPGDFERRVTVGAGETRTFDGLADGDYRVRTFSAIDENVYEIGGVQTATVDCAPQLQTVTVSRRCTAQGGTATITNPNDRPVQVAINGPGGRGTRITLEAGASRTFEGLPDSDYRVRTLTADDGDPVGDAADFTVACPTEQVQVRTQCTEDGGQVVVRNPNGEPVQVDVAGPGDFERRVTVGAGETRTFDALDDGAYRVRTLSAIDENVYEIGSGQSATVDCAAELEAVTVSQRCTADGGNATITNPNDRPVRVAISGPGGRGTQITLEAGASRTFEGLPDGDYRVQTLTADGGDQVGGAADFTVACPTEQVQVRTQCTEDGGQVLVRNPNEEPVQVDVAGPGDFERRVTVGAGETQSFEDLGDGEYAVRTFSAIDENVYEIGSGQSATVDCAAELEAVTVSQRCTAQGGTATITNPNDRPVQVAIGSPGGRENRITLEAGASRTFEGLADGEYRVQTLTADGGDPVGEARTLTVACPTDPVQFQLRCGPDGGQLVARNPNEEPVQVDVSGAGDFERRVTVGAGETQAFDALADGDYQVRTFSAIDENVYEIGSGQSATVACPTEPVELASACTGDGGVLRVTNPNDAAVQVDVDGPGDYEQRVTVGAGETLPLSPLANGGYRVATLSAIDENVYVIDRQQVETVNCGNNPALIAPVGRP